MGKHRRQRFVAIAAATSALWCWYSGSIPLLASPEQPTQSAEPYRIDLTFEPGSIPGPDWPVRIEVAFPRLLRELGIPGRVDRHSIRVETTGQRRLPSRVFYPAHLYSTAAFDAVAWRAPARDDHRFVLYFDTMRGTPSDPPSYFPMIGAGEPLVCRAGRIDAAWYALMAWGDLDGDGRKDLVAGGYNEIGFLNYYRDRAPEGAPVLSIPERLVSGLEFVNRLHYTSEKTHQPMGMGIPQLVDADRDGDLDLYVRYNEWYTEDRLYLENTGGPSQPVFVPGNIPDRFDPERHKPLEILADWNQDGEAKERVSVADRFLVYHDPAEANGKPFAAFKMLITCIAPFDVDADGLIDVMVGRFDGTLFFCRNMGRNRGHQRFERPRRLKGHNIELSAGSFSTPEVVDWDGDGDPDLLCGNEEGAVIHYENSGTEQQPVWSEQGYLYADGERILFSGDIREPNGQHWGYTTLSALDWDDDRDIDLLVTERMGQTHLFRNDGSRTHPRLTRAGALRLENGTPMVPHPRVKPGFDDWNGDGRPDVIMSSTNGVASLFLNAGERGDLVFQEPVVLHGPGGEPVYREKYGAQGRTRFVPIDWNADGKRDFLTADHAADGWPRYFENIGTRKDPRFTEKENPLVHGQPLWIGVGHAPCPAPWDWNGDGREDLLVGGEDGLVYHYDRRMFDPPPVLQSAILSPQESPEKSIDVLSHINLNRIAAAGTIRRDDFDRASGADRWTWNTDAAAHHGDLLSVEGAGGKEELIYDPKVEGVYDVYIGFMVQVAPARIEIRLEGDASWDPLETTVYLDEYKTSPDIAQPKHHFQAVPWKTTDLTNRRIEIRPLPGSTIHLDCLHLVPR